MAEIEEISRRLKNKIEIINIITQFFKEPFEHVGISPHRSYLNLKSTTIILAQILYIILGIAFLFFEAKTFLEYVMSSYFITPMIGCCISFIVILFKKEKLFEFFNNCTQFFIEMSDHLTSSRMLEEINCQGKIVVRIGHFLIVNVSPVCLIFGRAIICYAIYFSTSAGAAAFELPMPLWYPFDWKNPLGYLVAVTFQYIAVVYSIQFIFSAAIVGIVCSMYVSLFVIKAIQNDLNAINKIAVASRSRLETLSRLSKFIECHSTLKRLTKDFSDIYAILLVAVLTLSLISICGALLLIQMQSHERHPWMLLILILSVVHAFGVVFVVCEFGQLFSNAFEMIDDEIEAFDWYLFPHELQQMLPTILMVSQQPVKVRCFGSIAVDRETFKKVVKSGLSYFMTMRRFIK